jgi:uncharacterized protein (TIGR02145 family)
MKKWTKIWIFPLALMGMIMLIASSCKDDKEDPVETVVDYDGNIYHVVTIGNQDWLMENLKVTHYRNGNEIHAIEADTTWETTSEGAYCNYDNVASNGDIYGRLYNWYAVNDARKIAPAGWHIASDLEWAELTAFAGGDATAGGKLKEAGITHWKDPNMDATNEFGFTALPAGHRNYAGGFEYINWGCGFWSTTYDGGGATVIYLDYNAPDTYWNIEDHRFGRSVRCLRD